MESSPPPTPTNSSDSATVVQDSSIFSYINELSPIKPVNASPVAQGFPGLNSPLIVFMSPQIDTREPLDLKRTQYPLSLSRQEDDEGKNIPIEGDESEKSDSLLRLNSSGRDQTYTSTGCFEELLDGSTNSKEPVNLANKDDEPDLAMAVGASPENFEQANEENQGSSSFHLKPAEKDDLRHSEQQLPEVDIDVHSLESNPGVVFKSIVIQENAPYSIHQCNEYDQTSGVVGPTPPLVSNVTHFPKATHSEVPKRRRLQFDDAQHNFIAKSPCFWSPSSSPSFSRSPTSSCFSDVLDSSCVDIPATPSNIQLGNMSQSKDKNLMSTVSKPSGIGLHLNSIVNALPLSSNTKNKVADNICIKKPPLKLVEHPTTSELSGKENSEHSEIIEDFNQASIKKKRKRASEISDGDGCKRCNCKKTKCLKLYCDCFAAGIYCDDPCSCQGCFNRHEYEETVLDARQLIESRNPLAFAPKIIQRLSQVPVIRCREDGGQLAPLLGRHKMGCNCKKSMCLKKYCECYQANVGCSDACHCKGCKNINGRKGEYKISREAISIETINDKLDFPSEQKRELEATADEYLLPELENPQSSTPIMPSFQSSDHRKGALKSGLCSARYLPSPESETTLLPPNANVSESLTQETKKNILDLSSFDQEPDYAKVEVVDDFSPRCRKIGNICHLNSLLTYSTSNHPISFESSKRRDLLNNLRPEFGSGSAHMSSLRHQFGERKLQEVNSDDRLYEILEDETPQILKENSTPCNAVKVRSPNKKRVSPPYSCSSLTTLKSGRIILQSIPTFPPFSPCMGSNNSSSEKMKGPQTATNDE